jgi:hypothetical protein
MADTDLINGHTEKLSAIGMKCQICHGFTLRPFDVSERFWDITAIDGSAARGCFPCSVVAACVRQIIVTLDCHEESKIQMQVLAEDGSLKLAIWHEASPISDAAPKYWEIYTHPGLRSNIILR